MQHPVETAFDGIHAVLKLIIIIPTRCNAGMVEVSGCTFNQFNIRINQ